MEALSENSNLANFQKFYKEVSGIKSDSGLRADGYWHYRQYREKYTPTSIEEILKNGTASQKRMLSQYYFETEGLYKSIIIYYATLLNYYGILMPQTSNVKKIKEKKIVSKYNQALNFIGQSSFFDLCTNWSMKILRDGAYYGVITNINNNGITLIDLPNDYCSSDYVGLNGNEIIEFNVSYFDKITDEDLRKSILKNYPKIIQKAYRKYSKGGKSKVILPTEIGISFSLFDGAPLFLNIIPSIMQYKDAVDVEQERNLEEIKKIIVQKIPHIASTGELVFEPDEALEMHKGSVNMMKENKNVNVLTTYADVDAIVSKTSTDNSDNLEKMINNVYAASGVSSQLFSMAGASSLKYSMDKDLALMMLLANKYSRCISNLINFQFADNTISFTYNFLPVAEYNKSTFVADSLKLANSGYSFLLPSIAMGINQKDLVTIKTLENEVLQMGELLVPLSTSYTQSSNEGAGRPALKTEEKSDKTIRNEESINNQGGTE